MDLNALLAAKSDPASLAESLSPEDIPLLVDLLGEKNNDIRYAAFLVLKARSQTHADVYPWWDALACKLSHENSYQRSIGVMLLAENVRWDRENRLGAILGAYTAMFRDEKFITARQAVQSLLCWLSQKPALYPAVLKTLMEVPVMELPDTQRKLLFQDILEVLLTMRPISLSTQADEYLLRALNSALLDKKGKEALRRRMGMS